MTQGQQTCTLLARKYLLFSIGTYATLAGIMTINWLGQNMGLSVGVGLFVAFLITVFARTFYEQMVINDVPVKYLAPQKNAAFALVYATIMSLGFNYIRAPLGLWGIPVVMVIAQAVSKPLKNYLWPTQPREGFYALYVRKQDTYTASFYGFYGLLAVIVVVGVKYLDLPFTYSFGAAVLVALIATIMFEFHYLYEQPWNFKHVASMLLVALGMALATTAIVIFLITTVGLPGKAATILGCVAVKITEQYVLSRWMCAQKTCALCQRL